MILRLENITKTFSGVTALENVSMGFLAGRVHAICGENGAGKSTLMNIIVGNLVPDSGKIIWKHSEIHPRGVAESQQLGINIVYQERSLADALTIAENIFPNRQPKNRWGLIDYKKLYQQTQQLLNDLQLELSPSTWLANLSAGEKQMVEIAKAISLEPSLLILDEPTASLTNRDTEILFRIVRRLKEKGTGVIYISHRMNEIKEIADEVSILKDGRYQGTVDAASTPLETMVRMMVGRELQQLHYRSDVRPRKKLEVKNISGRGFENVSFDLFEGEVLGFAGLLGSGRTNLVRALFGDAEIYSGEIYKNGKPHRPAHPRQAINAGLAYVPEERKTLSVFADKSLVENIAVNRLVNIWYRNAELAQATATLQKEFDIRAASIQSKVRTLSGGNQQKMVLAKWLSLGPEILLVNEPTHGVDVGSKASIYGMLKGFTANGNSVILVSSELPELLLLSDRIVVMHQKQISAIMLREEATEEKITALASGIK